MNYKTKLKIGEFSKFMQVTVKTLRHYEQKGLLAPDEVDEWTGYRYYSIEQMQKLQAIRDLLLACRSSRKEMSKMEKISIQSLPEIIVASHREIIPDYAALSQLCCEKIGPEMQRLGCKCPPPGYCFTIEHNKEHTPTDIDIEYCEQVEEMGTDSNIIQFKRLPAVPKAMCVKHVGPYERFGESYTEAFRYMEEHGYEIAGKHRLCYIDGPWNQDDPEKWVSIIQIPIK